MKIIAAIAVRDSGDAKSRCAGLLSNDARSALVQAMLEDMIERLRASKLIDGILVVTPNPPLAQAAAAAGASTITEPAVQGINAAFDTARKAIRTISDEALMLTLPGDLPLVEPDALDTVLRDWAPGSILLAPSHDGGTAAILLQASEPFAFHFGPASFLAHQEEAAASGLTCIVREPAGLALDLDSPAQIAEVLRGAPGGRTATLLSTVLPPTALPPKR